MSEEERESLNRAHENARVHVIDIAEEPSVPAEILLKDRVETTQNAKGQNSQRGDDANDSGAAKTEGRNLVVCIDGTANQFGLKVSYVASHLNESNLRVEYTRRGALQPTSRQ